MTAYLNVWLLLMLSMFHMPEASLLPNTNPRPVSLAVVTKDSPFDRPKLIGYVIRAINLHRRKVSGFNARGYLRSIQSYSTKEILDAFCNDFFRNNTITLLHIHNPTFLPSPPTAVRYIPQLAKSVGIPILSWNPENTMASQISENSLVLEMAPRVYHQCEAMITLLDRYNWTDFTILTTEADGYEEFTYSLKVLAKRYSRTYSPGKVTHIQIEKRFRLVTELTIRNTSLVSITKNLKELKHTDTRVILLYATRSETLNIMEVAQKVGMTNSKYMWIVNHKSIGSIRSRQSSLPSGLLGVTFNVDMNVMKTVIETAIKIWIEALIVISRHLPHPTFYLNMTCDGNRPLRWNDGKDLYSIMKSVVIYQNKKIPVEFKKDGTLKNVEIDIVNLQKDKRWKNVGKWDNNGLVMHDITWPGNSTVPPVGKPEKFFMRVVTLEEIPYVRYRDMENGKCNMNAVPCRVRKEIRLDNGQRIETNETITRCCVGLSIDLLKILSDRVGFDYELFEVEDRIWGSRQPNGEWNGLVRSILDKKADFIMTSMKITPERNEAVDFTVPFLETGITIIVAIREGAVSPTAFLEPYDYPAWCLILVFSVHATGASIFIFEWLSPVGLHQGKTSIREHKFSLFRSFWLIWAMLFGASVNTDNPRGVSSRFLGNVWALFALVFLASYTANLAAFMITKEEFYDLSGIQDWRLMNPHALKPPFRFATIPNGSTETNLKKNYPSMYSYMSQFNRRDVTEGILALKKNLIDAFIYDATVLEYRAGQDDLCKLRTVGNWYAMTGYGIAFPKGSKHIDQFNQVLLELQHNGEMERLQKFWLAGACKKQDQTGESSHSLGILNFTSAFILLAGGMVLGSILLVVEHFYFRFGRKTLQKWDKCGCCGLVSLSMGKSLTFEQSVREALEQSKRHRCKDPLCETSLWKARHELDLALLKIEKLHLQLTSCGITPEPGAVWKLQTDYKYQGGGRETKKAIKFKDENGKDESPMKKGYKSELLEPVTVLPACTTDKNPSQQLSTGAPHPNKQVFRRSPSYTTAMSVDDDPKPQQPGKTRYHNGNYYIEVDNLEIESVL